MTNDIEKFSNSKKYATWFRKIGRILRNIFIGSTINSRIFRNYLYIILLGTLILMTPLATKKIYQWDFFVALFTASSAFSDTGLNMINPAKDLTFIGQLVIVFLIQLGGVGVMTLKIVLFMVIGRNIGIGERLLLQSERGGTKLGGTVDLIKNAFYVLAIVEITGGVMLFFYFYFTPIDYLESLKTQSLSSVLELLRKSVQHEDNYVDLLLKVQPAIKEIIINDSNVKSVTEEIIKFYNNDTSYFIEDFQNNEDIQVFLTRFIENTFNVVYHDFGRSFWSGIFHSISATNNAGFDIVGPNSLVSFRHHYFIQFVFLVQLIIGGIGYPVFYDLKQKTLARYRGTKINFSLFTKISVVYYFFIAFVGILVVSLVEFLAPVDSINDGYISSGVCKVVDNDLDAFLIIVFNTFSTRSAGYSTLDINHFKIPTKYIFSILMWIGASPSSTGGGIRTTTLALVFVSIIASATKKSNINMFKAKIPQETVKRATSVFILGISIVVLVSLIIVIENADISLIEAWFVTTSAFGTAGLSIVAEFGEKFNLYGITSKLFLISLMFIGQLGVSNTLLLAAKQNKVEHFAYVEQDTPIG